MYTHFALIALLIAVDGFSVFKGTHKLVRLKMSDPWFPYTTATNLVDLDTLK
jgi:hypothetical protein